VLDQLEEAGTGISPTALGLPEPQRFAEPVGRLLLGVCGTPLSATLRASASGRKATGPSTE
jgi:hypothetical protein